MKRTQLPTARIQFPHNAELYEIFILKLLFILTGVIFTLLNTVHAQNPGFAWARQGIGTGIDSGTDIAVGNLTGSVYTTGSFSGSADFDKNLGGWYLTSAGNQDIFISKTDAAGNMIWIKRIGSINNERGIHICVDNLENVYVSGTYTGTVDFDPGAGVFNLTSAFQASYIVKLTGAGNFAFAYSYAGTIGAGVSISSLQTDAGNNLYVSGQLNGTWDFDPGAGVANLSAYQVGFILKLNSTGSYVFAKKLDTAGSPNYNAIVAMSLDPSGNIIVTGNLQGSADFDMGAGVVTFSSSSTSSNNDYFVAKYTSAGNYIWAGLTGGTPSTTIWSQGCTTDVWGNVYVYSLSFGGSVDFNPTAGINSLATSNSSYWIQKLKSNGSFVWAKTIDAGIAVKSIKANTADGLYLGGTFTSTRDFNPGTSVFNLVANSSISASNTDIFILKLDSSFNFQWAKSCGASYSDNFGNFCVTTADNILTTGGFKGKGDFDPNAGISNLSSKGGDDIFIQRLNNAGLLTWVYGIGSETYISVNAASPNLTTQFYTTGSLSASPSTNLNHRGGSDIFISSSFTAGSLSIFSCLGGPGNDVGTGIINDVNNNIYLTGYFEQTANFTPTTFEPIVNLTSNGGSDIFILKINASGKLAWAKHIGALSDDQPNAITLDNAGNLFVTGFFQGTVDFDPGAGTSNLTSAGSFDAFVLKMDTAGNYMWAKNVGGATSEIGNDIAVDPLGNALVTGTFNNTADFDPAASVSNLSSVGNTDGFVLKLNSSGNFVWVNQIGSTQNDYSKCIETDATGNVYVGGNFGGSTDFDPGAGTFIITPPNNAGEIFIQKLNAAGNFVFAKSMGGTGSDQLAGLTLDAAGNIYTTGAFQGTADLNPDSASVSNFTSNGLYDTFISCFNFALGTSWTRTFGGIENDGPAGIAVDAQYRVYVAGNFGGTVDFNPDAGVSNLTAPGESDIFTMSLIQSSPLPVELVSFTASVVENKEVLCKWITASEINNAYFTIERSEDGIHFEEVTRIAGNGNSSSMLQYSDLDNQPYPGQSYYRLKQTDFDGLISYSKMQRVLIFDHTQLIEMKTYPNPTNDFMNIEFFSDEIDEATIQVIDITGKIIIVTKFSVGKGNNSIEVNLINIPAGMYNITVAFGQQLNSKRIIKK